MERAGHVIEPGGWKIVGRCEGADGMEETTFDSSIPNFSEAIEKAGGTVSSLREGVEYDVFIYTENDFDRPEYRYVGDSQPR